MGQVLDITMNGAQNLGRLDPSPYFLQGFSSLAMVLTGIAGEIVTEAIASQAERCDVYERIRQHDFPGGMALGRPTLMMAMPRFRLKDLLP